MAPPRAVVVVTGSELVRGDRRDLNGPFLAQELDRLGLEPARVVVVGDRPEELAAAFADGLRADLCVVSGGLGPTHDDRTVELLAASTGRALSLDEELAAEIEAFSRGVAERLGRPFADFLPGNPQAGLPSGGRRLARARGDGAGDSARARRRPSGDRASRPAGELRRLWPNARRTSGCAGARSERADAPTRRSLRFFGPTESAVARVLDEAGGEGEGFEATVCARDLEIHVDLLVRPGGEAPRRARRMRWRRVPDDLFARDDERPVEELVLDLCREQGLTLATAESCTGGLIGARLTEVPGASDVFLGGVIAYSNEVKERSSACRRTCSGRTARSRRRRLPPWPPARATALGADVAIADTGIAGPGGGTPEKPVGLVFLAVDGPAEPTRRACSCPETGRPSARGRPRWLCTYCGASWRVPDAKPR